MKSAIPDVLPGQARIYFYRASVAGGMIQPSIVLNGSPVGTARPNGFFFVDVSPGPIEISITTEVERKVAFALSEGQTRYVRVAVGFGILVGRFYPQLVESDEAEREMAALAYSGPELAGRAASPQTAAPRAAPEAKAAGGAAPVKLEDLQDLMQKK